MNKNRSKTLRTITALAVVVVISIGFVTNLGIGTLSAPGFWDISILCPMGALTTMLASKTMVPRALISFVIMLLLVVVFARAFCGWICPVPLVQRFCGLFRKKERTADAGQDDQIDATASACEQNHQEATAISAVGQNRPDDMTADGPVDEKHTSDEIELTDEDRKILASIGNGGCAVQLAKRGDRIDARHFILIAALVSTVIFGYPVFCLICPIGLTFATILLVINLFALGDVTWSVIVAPVVLIVEVVVLKKWCHNLCPLSALMSLVGKANKTFVPTIDDTACLETSKKASCGACGRACKEGIDPRHPELSEAAWSECTKCRACVDACPAHAISMPLLTQKPHAADVTPKPRRT
jgi:ferredoxin-type protein NapH